MIKNYKYFILKYLIYFLLCRTCSEDTAMSLKQLSKLIFILLTMLITVRYITHNSYTISIMSSFNRL